MATDSASSAPLRHWPDGPPPSSVLQSRSQSNSYNLASNRVPLCYMLSSNESLTARECVQALAVFLAAQLVAFIFLAFPLNVGCGSTGQINWWMSAVGHYMYGILIASAGWIVGVRGSMGTPLWVLVPAPIVTSLAMLATKLLEARYGQFLPAVLQPYQGLLLILGVLGLVLIIACFTKPATRSYLDSAGRAGFSSRLRPAPCRPQSFQQLSSFHQRSFRPNNVGTSFPTTASFPVAAAGTAAVQETAGGVGGSNTEDSIPGALPAADAAVVGLDHQQTQLQSSLIYSATSSHMMQPMVSSRSEAVASFFTFSDYINIGKPRVQAASLLALVCLLLTYYTVLSSLTVEVVFGHDRPGVWLYLSFTVLGFAVRFVCRILATILDSGKTGTTSLYFLVEMMVAGWYYSFYRLLFTHVDAVSVFLLWQAVHLATEWVWAAITTTLYFRVVRVSVSRFPKPLAKFLEWAFLPTNPLVTRADWAGYCCLDYSITAAMQVQTAMVWLWSSHFIRYGYNASYFNYCGGIDEDQYVQAKWYLGYAILSEVANCSLMHLVFWRRRHRLNLWAQLIRYMQKPLVQMWCLFNVSIVSINTFHAVTKGDNCLKPFPNA